MSMSGGGSSKALTRAMNAALAAQREGTDKAVAQYDTALKDYNNYLGGGLSPNAGGLYSYLSTGIENPESKAALGYGTVYDFINNSPAYQYQLDQSEKGINRAMAARGMWNSAAAGNMLAENRRGLAATNWQDYYDRLGNYQTNLANQAYNTAAAKGSAYQNLGNMSGQTISELGQAKAQAKQALSSAKYQGWQNVFNQSMGVLAAYLGSKSGGGGSSDLRLKNILAKLADDPRGFGWYVFEYKADPGETHVGVIAQELLEVMPEAVSTDENGFYKVNYSMLALEDWE